ncbi:hypothetical protein VIBR0546_09810 [Vibrio brasiliensis LMG 20546]|uniref:Uncharacterized protein n=1 Tax=Vibrio brasiliensis LMG 20546 TaxID=945543 RepID=E8LPP6_9VIBR|nr:hypothetical protein VIBR0546_09810 [Vibrio brasiliensis LMG 20546]
MLRLEIYFALKKKSLGLISRVCRNVTSKNKYWDLEMIVETEAD